MSIHLDTQLQLEENICLIGVTCLSSIVKMDDNTSNIKRKIVFLLQIKRVSHGEPKLIQDIRYD